MVPFSVTASLTNGTKGCGSICAVLTAGQLLAIGDGDISDRIEYGGVTATMIDMPEVNYGTL